MNNKKYGIVILNWNNYIETKKCIKSILSSNTELYDVKIYLIDNDSKDGSGDKLKDEFSNLVCYYNTGENKGYTGGNNFGIKKALQDSCDYILILNNDLEIENFSSLLQSLDDVFKYNPKIGITGFDIYNKSTKQLLKSAGKINEYLTKLLNIRTDYSDINKYISLSYQKAVCGCAICFKSDCINEIGLFDESFFMYAEEQDICLRAIKYDWKVGKIRNQKSKIYRQVDEISENQLIWYYGTRNIFCAYKKNIIGYKKYIFISLQFLIYLKQIIYFFIKSNSKISYKIIIGLKDAFIGNNYKGKS